MLHGETTFTGSCSFDEGVLDMNGYNLTGNVTALNLTDVRNPGTVTTSVACEGPGLKYAGSDAALNVVMVNKTFTYKAADDVPCYWNISFAPYNGALKLTSGTRLDGAVTAGAGKSLTITQTAAEFHLRGKVTAPKSLVRNRAAETELWLHAANAIGAITQNGGVIVAATPESIPAAANVTLDTGSLSHCAGFAFYPATAANPDGWTAAEIDAYLAAFADTSSNIFGIAADVDDESAYETDLASWAYKFYFGGYGRGTTTLKSPTSSGNATVFNHQSGSTANFRLAGKDGADLGTLKTAMGNGRATLRDAGAVTFASDTIIGAIGGGRSVLTVGAGSSLTSTSYLRVPSKNGTRAALEILDGGAFTNKAYLYTCSSGENMESGLFLRGGEISTEGTLRTGWMANTLSYLEQTKGTWRVTSDFELGGGSGDASTYDAGIAGIFYLKDGVFSSGGESRFFAGASGTGVVHQTGGKMTIANGLFLAKLYDSNAPLAGWGEVTVSGGTLVSSNDVVVADTPNSTGILNLRGAGLIETPSVRRQYPTTERGNKPVTNALGVVTTTSYVNFNGGTLKAHKAGSLLAGGLLAPDRTTVFAGGLTVDTNARDVSFDTPLLAPTGAGVVALTLPNDGAPLTGYFIAPRVVIEGDGQGATAVADFDSLSGIVTGVTVTSPGWGYTAAKTTAKLLMGQDAASSDWTAVTLSVTLAADALTGGLTKRGEGTLTLNAANAYAGATVVEAGTLRLGVANALPNAALVMKGGSLAVADGVAYPADLSLDVSNLDFTDLTATHTLAANWTGALPAVTGIPDGWTLVLKNGDLVLRRTNGFIMIFH